MIEETIGTTFEFKLGEIVYFKSASHDINQKPVRFTVVARLAEQCMGGIQRFYRLDTRKEWTSEIALTRDEPAFETCTTGILADIVAMEKYRRLLSKRVAEEWREEKSE